MEWQQFAEWMFYGVLGFCAVYLARTMELMRRSIERLNIKIAVVIEKTTNHEKRITKIESKMDK
jgi:hypothetical protein